MWGNQHKISTYFFYGNYIIDMGDDGLKNNKYIWLSATISMLTLGGVFMLKLSFKKNNDKSQVECPI